MSEKVCFTKLETEEKLNYLYDEIRTVAFKQGQVLEELEYMGKQLRKIEIIQGDMIADNLDAIVADISDMSKKMDRITGMETVLNAIKSDVKIIKEL